MKLGALLFVSLLAGCTGSLSVTVDVLDPAFARAEIVATQRTEQCLFALKETGGSIDHEVAEINRTLREAHEALSVCYVDEARRLTAAGQDGTQLSDLATALRIGPADIATNYGLDPYRQQRLERMRVVGTAASTLNYPLAACRNPPPDLAAALVERRSLVHAKQAEIAGLLGTLQRDAAARCPEASAPEQLEANEKVEEVARVVQSPVAGLTLGSSPYAYALASAPDDAWDNLFNEAFGRGVMGNVDIAVKLNEEADFSVKGMRFDATKVAEVAAKVTTQAVLLASRIAGGPARTSGNAPSGNAAGDAVAQAQQLLDERRALEAARRDAISEFALSLIDSRQAVDAGGDVTREAQVVRSRLTPILPLLRLEELD